MEVMSGLDILIGAFENIVSGREYEELRQGGPKQLNIQFSKDIQARMSDPNYKFSPELKLKPKGKLVSRKHRVFVEATKCCFCKITAILQNSPRYQTCT